MIEPRIAAVAMSARCARRAVLAVVLLASASVAESRGQKRRVDPDALTRQAIVELLGAELAASTVVPFALDAATLAEIDPHLSGRGGDRRRTDEILAFIFGELDLKYAATPTRSGVDAYRARQGNCLSFVNLFVGVARRHRLHAFFVEVEDYRRWNYQDGVVLSRGHIVAGLYLDGRLSTFDFLPYRPKAYRSVKPIEDLKAMAHHYNNLGAEALLAGDLASAERELEIARRLEPTFDKAINNLGVVYLRRDEVVRALALYRDAVGLHPTSVPLLTNLARAHQRSGDAAAAAALLDRLDQLNLSNPFFYLYRAEVALAGDRVDEALDYLRQALRADSELPEVHLGLVQAYLAAGRLDEARHHLERALKLDPSADAAGDFAALLGRR